MYLLFWRECPEECREAVASLMFAAARFADLPELRELRAVFTERYGNSIDCYANKEVRDWFVDLFLDFVKEAKLPILVCSLSTS